MEKIFPFLWLHGEDKAKITEEIYAIYNSGIRAFCIESRPHPEFCKDGWWRDLDLIFDLAKQLKMEVWILDDKKFPTGFANGAIEKNPEFAQKHIAARCVDVVGGITNKIILESHAGDELVAVFSVPQKADGLDFSYLQQIDKIKDGFAFFDLESGLHRIISVWKTSEYSYINNYIDMMNPKSVQLLIDEVYQPHYARYKEYFGNVFQGFFSDEPCLGNWYNEPQFSFDNIYGCKMGKIGLTYPFYEGIKNIFENDKDYLSFWYDFGERSNALRCKYMNAVTDLYSKNFSERIGTWCRERGVKYIGHIIEDMNAHVHSGCGAGHYFKSQSGQDMAGIDVVLHQIKPYSLTYRHLAPISGGIADPDFFIYTLPVLASSCSSLDNRKQGNSMCEIFGAYGFSESVKDMKYLADMMIIHGINHFVPHAFSPKENDDDCPPHFYANGQNPIYKSFKELIKYMNKLCGIFSDGKQVAEIGVLYHAEADWSGKKYMPVDQVLKKLSSMQKNAVIVPYEYIDKLSESGLKDFIVPYSEYLPENVKIALDNIKNCNLIYLKKDNLESLPEKIKSHDISLKKPCPELFYYHYLKANDNIYMFFNAGCEQFEGEVEIGYNGILEITDILNDRRETLFCGGSFILKLGAGATAVCKKTDKMYAIKKPFEKTLKLNYEIYLKEFDEKEFIFYKTTDTLTDLNGIDGKPDFSGTAKYSAEINLEAEGTYYLRLGKVGGTAEAIINGKTAGVKIFVPFVFEVYFKKGLNKLEIEISNTLANAKKDPLSFYNGLEAFGLLEDIKLITE